MNSTAKFSARRTELDWSVGHHADANTAPERFVPAQVPGAVQLDWARAEGWPPHWYAENFRAYDWMEDCFWTYRAQVPAVSMAENERLFFVCKGVDYQWELWIDGQLRHAQEGMFAPYELELSPADAGKELLLRVHPTPKTVREPRNREQASHSVKPAVSYGWDWHPRLIPLAYGTKTFLEVRAQSFLQSTEVFVTLNDDFSSAHLRIQCAVNAVDSHSSTRTGSQIRWQLFAPDGSMAHEATIEAEEHTALETHLQNRNCGGHTITEHPRCTHRASSY
jgi:beta-mannosidase